MDLTESQQKQLNKLVTLVTLRVDEYTEGIDGVAPEAPVGDIEYELEQAARSVVRMAARHSAFVLSKSLNDDELDVIQPSAGSKRGTIVLIPEDFLRLLSIKMTDWYRSATKLLTDESRAYNQQIYDYRRGTNEKPFAAVIPYHHTIEVSGGDDKVYKRAIEVFPESETVESFTYLPYVPAYDMPSEFKDLLVWKAVVSILLIMRLPNEAQTASAKEQQALSELNSGVFSDQPPIRGQQ